MSNDSAHSATEDQVAMKTFVEYDAPFQDASFYNPGAVANVWKGNRTVEIDIAGDLDITRGDTQIWKSEELRTAFPDGNLDLDGWSMESNRWFEFFAVNGTHSTCVEGEVAYDYDEAIAFAKELLEDDDYWDE